MAGEYYAYDLCEGAFGMYVFMADNTSVGEADFGAVIRRMCNYDNDIRILKLGKLLTQVGGGVEIAKI